MPQKNNTRLCWDSSGTMEIQLTQGQWALINTRDYPRVKAYRWCAQKSKHGYYAVTGGSKDRLCMHRLIKNAPADLYVDHHNHNTLDNTDGNLRVCTCRQNLQNKTKDTSSPYKGVSKHKPSGKWLCHIMNQHLGLFEDAETAGWVYDIAAELLYGEYAMLNRDQHA